MEKPVGQIWLALTAEGNTQAWSICLLGDRLQNNAGAAEQLLFLWEDFLSKRIPEKKSSRSG